MVISYRRFGTNYRSNLFFWGGGSCPMKMGPMGCPDMSVRNYHYSLRNNPEEHSSHLLRGGSLKSRKVARYSKCKMPYDIPVVKRHLLYCRSQWPRGLRRKSSAARLLRLWVRIPPGAWISVCCVCCVLSGRGLCDGLITRPEESYRLWRVEKQRVSKSK